MRFTITQNAPMTRDVYHLALEGDTSAFTRPGQFAQVAIPGFYLRRPISVCDWHEGHLTLIYKVVGEGTAALSRMCAGESLDLLTGLGNGFTIDETTGDWPLLVGGGVGLPPLYGLARHLQAAGKKPLVIAGFNTASEQFLLREMENSGISYLVTTADGTLGIRGMVTDALAGLDYTSLYACGPLPMMKALYQATACPAQFSLEERMGCGFGACMGCSTQTANGPKRVCADGPIFRREELLWQI